MKIISKKTSRLMVQNYKMETKEFFHKYRLPYHSDKVPKDTGGIYFFTLRFPTDYELGLNTEGQLSFDKAFNLIKTLTDKYARVYNYQNLYGILADNKSDHLKSNFVLNANYRAKISPSEILDDIRPNDIIKLREVSSILRISFDVSIPVYIGLTFEQSLSERLEQHLNGMTSMSSFIKEFDLAWDNFHFNCNPIIALNKKELRGSEKLIQNIFKPRFSKG